MRLPAYSEYNASGIDGLGDIPGHWKALRVKYCVSINDEALSESTDPSWDMLYVDISSIDATSGISKKENYRFEQAPSRARRIVRNGDVIVSTVRTYLRAIAPIIDPEENLVVSTGFAVVRPRDGLCSDFAIYALRAPYFVDAVVARSVGVSYPAINASEIGTLGIAIPPVAEQKAIAKLLDRETERIDALIEKKERQIELLKEKRSAIISHAVTKGLDPNAKMKPSGVEWLGDIPEHWRVFSLKFVAHLASGESITSERISDNGDYPVFGGNGLRGFTDDCTHEGEYPLIGRQGALCGCINYSYGLFWASEHAVVLAPVGNNIAKWLGELLRAMDLNQYSQSAAQPGIAVDRIAALLIPVPPVQEQVGIADYIATENKINDSLIEKIEQSIEKLREYRTALISAAVTGKIDVREEVGV